MIRQLKNKAAATGLALALAAASLYAPPQQLDMPRFANQRGTVEVKEELARAHAPINAIMALPAALGLMKLISSGLVVSVQTVTVVIAAGATSNTGTLSPTVTTATASCMTPSTLGPHTTCNSATDTAGVAITSTSQVTATRNTSDASNALTLVVPVIDWNPSKIQSIQQSTTTMTAATSNTSTLGTTLAAATNAAIVFNGSTTTNTGNAPTINKANCQLTNTTTVTVRRNTGTNNLTVYWTVIEFKSGVLNSNTQSRSLNISSGNSGNDTITAVTMAQTVLFWGGHQQNHGSYDPDHEPYIQLTSTTNVALTRAGSGGSADITVYYHVVEFKAADIATIQRGTVVIATSSASNTISVSPAVTSGKGFANYLGKTNSNSATNGIDKCDATLALTSTTQATATRSNADASSTETLGYEIVGFA